MAELPPAVTLGKESMSRDVDLHAEQFFDACPSGEWPVSPIKELQLLIARLDQQINSLLARADSAGQFGDPKFASLNAQNYRSRSAELGHQREAAIRELESYGVQYVRRVKLEQSPRPTTRFKFKVVASSYPGPTGDYLTTLYWGGNVGCLHEIDDFDAGTAEVRAIAEHREKCQEAI